MPDNFELEHEQIPIALEDLELGIKAGTVQEIFPTEVDLKVGQQLRFFIDRRGESVQFVKLFKGSQTEASNEIENARKLGSIAGNINVVSPVNQNRSEQITTVAYPFVEGTNLQLSLEQLKGLDRIMEVAIEAIDQTTELSISAETLEIQEYSVSPKFLVEYPFPADVFKSPIYAEINKAYVPFWVLRKNLCMAFPGFSLDRHSRNILLDSQDVMHHIDFEVIVKDSPIFDFVKITRNGPENPFPLTKEMWRKALEDPKSAFYEISPFSEDQEYELVEYFAKKRFPDTSPDLEFFKSVYETAAAHTHLSYIRKYFRRYLISDGNLKDMAEARLYYHFIGFLALADKLKDITDFENHKGVANSVSRDQIEVLNQLTVELAKNFVEEYAGK